MDLGIGGRIELVVMHPPLLQQFFPKPTGIELDDVHFLTASIEPPENQCKEQK